MMFDTYLVSIIAVCILYAHPSVNQGGSESFLCLRDTRACIHSPDTLEAKKKGVLARTWDLG